MGNLCMGGTSQGSAVQPRDIPEGGAEGRHGGSAPSPCQMLNHMPELKAFSKEAECLPEATESWENAIDTKGVKLSERSLSTEDLLLTLCLLLIHLWDKTKECVLVLNPLKMWDIPALWKKLLYMLGMVTGEPHKQVTFQPTPVNSLEAWNSSKSITAPCCCVEGETEAHCLMALVANCQNASAVTDIAVCVLLTILHPNLFSGI